VGGGPLDVVRDDRPLPGGEPRVQAVDGLVERVVEPLERPEPLEDEVDHDAPAVAGVRGTPGVAGPVQPVDDPGDGAGGEAGGPGELAGRLGAPRRQEGEDHQVGARQAEPVGEDLLEEPGRLAELPQDQQEVVGARRREGRRS
jgi:hypothetical protein